MVKYKKKIPNTIEAEQYKPGMEDGWVVNFTTNLFDYTEIFKEKNEALNFIKNNKSINIDDREKSTIIFEDPKAYIALFGYSNNYPCFIEKCYVNIGDFIVKDLRQIYSPDEFYFIYEEVK